MRISLTRGKFVIVDEDDYDYLMQWKWYTHSHGYAKRTNESRKVTWMHRVILERMGFKDFTHSDHINQDKLDNRRCNLRPATSSQNQYNQRRYRCNSSGYKGVAWRNDKGKWRARIIANQKDLHLGYFETKEEAALAYNEAALKYHGEFASLNEVQ